MIVVVVVWIADTALDCVEFSAKSDEEQDKELSDKDDGLFGLARLDRFDSNGSAGRFGDEKVNGFRLLLRFPGTELSAEFFLAFGLLAADAEVFRLAAAVEDDNFSSVSESD